MTQPLSKNKAMKDASIRFAPALFALLGFAAFGPAQADPTVEDFQTWATVTAIGSFEPIAPGLRNFRYWLEGQGRFGNDSSSLSQGMVRPGLGYALNENASLWLGYAFVPTMEPFTTQDFNEHRIWQQFLWTDKTFLGTFTSRSRFEERFINQPDTAYRFRQLFKLSYPLSFAPNFSLVGSDELFINVNTTGTVYSGFEQNRVFAGLGYNFDEHIKAEVGYMNQYIRRVERADRISHILSVNLLLNY
jgi:hypothetical protein